jgi:hypothetical protein
MCNYPIQHKICFIGESATQLIMLAQNNAKNAQLGIIQSKGIKTLRGHS